MDSIYSQLPEWLGSLTGSVLGTLAIAILYVFVWFWVWGLWIALILGKAGFNGKSFWYLYMPLNLPIFALPVTAILNDHALEYYLGFTLFSLWFGVVLVAVVPWPLRHKPKPHGQKLPPI